MLSLSIEARTPPEGDNENRRYDPGTYRRTGCHLQMTVICIPPCGEIGLEAASDGREPDFAAFRFVKNPLRNCLDLDGIIRTIKGNRFEIYRKEMERRKDTGSLKT